MTERIVPVSSAQSSTGSDGRDTNVVDLIGHLTRQSAHLAQEQVNLVQAEMREAAADIKEGVSALLGAAVLGIAGLGVTLMGIAYVIGDAIGDRDLATLLVGIVVLAISAILYFSARKKMAASHLKPTRTINAAEDTPQAFTGDEHKTGAAR